MMSGYLCMFSSPCRLCLNDEEFQIPIFEEYSQKRKIALKINSCLPIVKVEEDDALPKNICYKCLSTLDILYEFWQKCCISETILRNHFGHTTYSKGYQIDSLNRIEYPSSVQNQMSHHSAAHSAQVRFAESDSEDDWPILNNTKRRKMCIRKSKQNMKQSNGTRHITHDKNNSRNEMQATNDVARKNTEPIWKHTKQSEEEIVFPSSDFTEIVTQPNEEDDVTSREKNKTYFHSNSDRFSAMKTIEDRKFIANFWRQTNTEDKGLETNAANKSSTALSPRSKNPVHRHTGNLNNDQSPHEIYKNHNFPNDSNSRDNSSYKLTDKTQHCSEDCLNESMAHFDSSVENMTRSKNLIIPKSWLPESAKYKKKDSLITVDINNKKNGEKNPNDESYHQKSSNTMDEDESLSCQKGNAHGEMEDMSYLLMNTKKGYNEEAVMRTRNLLQHFRTCQNGLR